MNKKLLLGAALLVGMGTTFTSCVDSTESPSVTAIRDAKAEQLKSIAEFNKAQAQAALLLAQAEQAAQAANQALQEAQAVKLRADAEYQAAQAELLRAQAALLNAQTEAEKEKLAYELKLLQAELDKKAQELEEAKAELKNKQDAFEIELQRLQEVLNQTKIQTQQLQFAYDQMVKQAQKYEDYEKKQEALQAAARIKTLIDNVKTASVRLTAAQTKLAKDKMTLARLEAGLQQAKQVLIDKIADLKDENLVMQSYIEAYTELLSKVEQYAGQEIYYDDVINALEEFCKADAKMKEASETYKDALLAYIDAQGALTTSDYEKLVEMILDDSGNYYTFNDKMEENDWYSYKIELIGENQKTYYPEEYEHLNGHDWAINVPEACRGKYTLIVAHYDLGYSTDAQEYQGAWTYTFTPVFENIDIDQDYLDKTDPNSAYQIVNSWYNLVNDGAGVQAWLQCRLNVLQNAKPTTLEDLQKILDEAIKRQSEADKALGEAQTALGKAKEKDDKAKEKVAEAEKTAGEKLLDMKAKKEIAEKEGATEAQIKAAEDAETAYNTATAAVETAREEATAAAEESGDAFWDVEDAKSNLKYANAIVTVLKNDIANVSEGISDNAAQIEKAKEDAANIIAESSNNQANIEAYNEASKARVEAKLPYYEAKADYAAAKEFYEDIDDAFWNEELYGGDPEANFNVSLIRTVINLYKRFINENLDDIKTNEEALAKLNSAEAKDEYGRYYEDLKLDYQKNIADDQAEEAAAQQLYDIAVAELEAALAEQQK